MAREEKRVPAGKDGAPALKLVEDPLWHRVVLPQSPSGQGSLRSQDRSARSQGTPMSALVERAAGDSSRLAILRACA